MLPRPPLALPLTGGILAGLYAAPAQASRTVALVSLSGIVGLQLLGYAITLAKSRLAPISPAPDLFAVVTGASSGIGRACAHALVRRGFNVLLVARRGELLKELQRELLEQAPAKVKAAILPLDLAATGDSAGEAVLRALADREAHCGLLVSAAGASNRGEFLGSGCDVHLSQLHLNTWSHMELIRTLAQPMCERRQGRVLVISSIVGSAGQPFNAAYAGSKALLSSLCDALHYELGFHGVGVTCVLPGATDTGFAHAGGSEDGLIFKLPCTTAEQVAEAGVLAMLRGERQMVIGHVATLFYLCGAYCPTPISSLAAAILWQSPAGALTHLRAYFRRD